MGGVFIIMDIEYAEMHNFSEKVSNINKQISFFFIEHQEFTWKMDRIPKYFELFAYG